MEAYYGIIGPGVTVRFSDGMGAACCTGTSKTLGDDSCCVMMPLLEQLSYNCVAYCACQWHLAVVVRSQWVGVVSLLSTSTVEVPCVLYQQGRAEQS